MADKDAGKDDYQPPQAHDASYYAVSPPEANTGSQYRLGYSFEPAARQWPNLDAYPTVPMGTEPGYGQMPWMALYADRSVLGQNPSAGPLVPGWVDPAIVAPEFITPDRPAEQVESETEAKPSSHTSPDPNSVAESGRTYHGYDDGSYFLPNDGPEQERLDFQHAQNRLVLEGRLFLAPVQDPKHVLDVAAGTGIWAIEFANEHPNTQVVGTDLSLIQPKNLPSNCDFIRENSETAEWIFPQKFDLIHLGMVCTCFNEPKRVMQKAFDNLNAGGWIEYYDGIADIRDSDGSTQNTAIRRYTDLFVQGGKKLGRDLCAASQYGHWLRETGFVDVTELRIPLPSNTWPREKKWKDIGRWTSTNWVMGLESFSLRILQGAGMSVPEIREFLPKVAADIRDTNIHAYFPYVVVYARKPYEWESEVHSSLNTPVKT